MAVIRPNTSVISAASGRNVERSATGAKRLKLRTMLTKFCYTKRSDSDTAEIIQLHTAAGLAIIPPIIRLGDAWCCLAAKVDPVFGLNFELSRKHKA